MTWKTLARTAIRFTIAGLLILIVGDLVLFRLYELGGVTTMEVHPVQLVAPRQGWSEKVTRAYRHQSQGTKIFPVSWFYALEQPILSPFPAPLFSRRDYLERFGFLYETDQAESAEELPIGFAIEKNFVAAYANPPIETPTDVVGLTCAACHTGRLDVIDSEGRLKGFLVEGGSAMINIGAFQDATGLALGYTNVFPTRFNRFARRVLGSDLPDDNPDKRQLRRDLKTFIETGLATKNYMKDHKLNPIESGYARTDALGLIGNRVFGVVGPENQVVTDAPVNFPHVWDTAWFDWVQYNGSIRMPMARNIGEALGVGAVVNLDPTKGKLYESTVNVEGLHLMESWLGGSKPFEGLQPPRWDSNLFGAIRPALAAEGKALYKAHCQRCHLPPRDELKADLARDQPRYFEVDTWADKRFLKLQVHDLDEIGTDPNQVLNFYRRVAAMPRPLPGAAASPTESNARITIPARVGLFLITSFIRRDKYQSPALGLLSPGDPATVKDLVRLQEYDRWRGLDPLLIIGDQNALVSRFEIDSVILAPLGYKSRPLDGIWATPPYLHNGSVPNLHQILLPVAQRDSTFYLGSKRFDPVHVGYQSHQVQGAFLLDTSLSGNHNSGHEYRHMTIDELEAAQGIKPDLTEPLKIRWSRVLAVTPDDYSRLSASEVWSLVRRASLDARGLPHYVPTRGVLGVEFTDLERWRLLEYLKNL